MSDAFQERTFVQGLTVAEVTAAVNAPGGCFDLYRVEHRASFLTMDGKLMICWFAVPDAEALRSALRQMEADSSGIWAGASYQTPGLTRDNLVTGNVLIERNFVEPTPCEVIQAQEQVGASSLAEHQASFLLAFHSRDGKRTLLLYRAPDTNSVSVARHNAKLPVDRVWPVHTICRD